MFRALMIGALSLFALSGIAFAQQTEYGTAPEAKAMLLRAIPELKANETAALAKFNQGADGFKDRDLYVFCFNTADGKFTAHQKAALIGTDVRDLKDKSGNAFGQDIYKAVNGEKDGDITEVSYLFPRPGTTDPVPKVSYLTKVGDQGCGVGYYK
ncbi:MAG: cache domain-containing protein [Vulcanimicrobiaceae bacterium]